MHKMTAHLSFHVCGVSGLQSVHQMSSNNEAELTKIFFVIINNLGVAHVFRNTTVKPVVVLNGNVHSKNENSVTLLKLYSKKVLKHSP